MNVRFYQERALRASRGLLQSFGLDSDDLAGRGARLVQKDTYVRYLREQFQGATLAVKGGVLAADADAVRLYFELVNDARSEIAATFILLVGLVDAATRSARPLPETSVAAAAKARIELPEHGRPRTIDLGPPRLDLAYEALAARLVEDERDPMSRRMERVIGAAECDEHGFLDEGQDMMFGAFRPPPRTDGGQPSFGPMTFVSDEGQRLGWASMETRSVRLEQPRAGDTIRSIGAEIGLGAKIRHSRRWLFNATTGALLSLNDNVNVALDLDARRSIEIPPSIRRQLEQRHAPEFA